MTSPTTSDTLSLLAGTDDQFRAGLVELGWFNYPPTLTGERPMGRARLSLDPKLYSAGEVAGTGASVYRLTLKSHRWQDAVKVVESHIHQRPHFAVVFVTLPRAVMIIVPEDPDEALNQKPAIRATRIERKLAEGISFQQVLLHLASNKPDSLTSPRQLTIMSQFNF